MAERRGWTRKIGTSQFVIYHSLRSVAIIPRRCDSIARGRVHFHPAVCSFTARRIARPFVAAEIIYLHISSAREIPLIPQTIGWIIYLRRKRKIGHACFDRSRDRLLCFSNSLPRSAASVNRDRLGRRCTISTLDLTRSHTFLNFRNFSHLQKKICYNNKLNEIQWSIEKVECNRYAVWFHNDNLSFIRESKFIARNFIKNFSKGRVYTSWIS